MKFNELILEVVGRELTQGIALSKETVALDNDVQNHHRNTILDRVHPDTYKYTISSKILNRLLWGSKKGEDIPHEDLTKISNIHHNLDSSDAAKDDLIVYSGVRRDPQKMVKNSGGLVHHAPLMSASINANSALNFAKDIEGTGIRHVLKIKVRKGQQVGGYIGEKSAYTTENEYLLKGNQMLHIHPEFDEMLDEDGKTIRVHHAIIMHPHEYEHLTEHEEVKSHAELKDKLKAARSELESNYDKDIKDGRMDSININMLNPIFNKRHIDALIDNPSVHHELLRTQTLSKEHIDKIIKSGHEGSDDLIASQKNLDSSHVEHLIKKNNDEKVYKNLLGNRHINLDKSFIDELVKNPTYHRDLAKSTHIKEEHIDKLIEYGDNVTHSHLAQRSDLNENHINEIADKGDTNTNTVLCRQKKLTTNNITNILKTPLYSSGYRVLSTHKNLNSEHITHILKNSSDDSDDSDSNLMSIMSNHTLTPEHKQIINDSSSFSKKSKDMANGLIPPPPQSSEHISHRFDTYTSPSTQTPKKSISQQFADKYTSISQHFKNKYSLKEGFINNSFFEKMLLENLTSSTLKKGVLQE